MSEDKHPTEKVGRKPKINKSGNTSMLIKLRAAVTERFSKLSRNTILAGSLALVLVIVGIVSLVTTGDSQPVAQQPSDDQGVIVNAEEEPLVTGIISRIEGNLEIKQEDGNWVNVPTANEQSVMTLTELRTVGAASRAVITLDDDSQVRMDANTEIEFVDVTPDRVVVKQTSGYVYSRLVPSDERTYIVQTEDAQYEALGTAFRTSATGDEQAVEVFHNTVHETTTNQKPKEGEKLTVKSIVDPTKDETIEKLSIDTIKNDRFIEWNRELDLADDAFSNSLGFLRDIEGPPITVSSAKDGDTVFTDPDATEGTITFTGTTEKDAVLTVQSKSESGSEPVTVAVGTNGEFSTPVITGPLGSSVFEFISTDKSGNATTLSLRITFQRKSAPAVQDGITLSVDISGSDVELDWTLTGDQKTPDGVKVLYSKTVSPSFPSDVEKTISSSSKRSTSFDISEFDSGETYYFRVCAYDEDEGSCSPYSNQDFVTIP